MASWVVPSVAAEIWNVSIQDILGLVKAGAIASREVESFLFVDVAPVEDGARPPALPESARPPTYSLITSAEMAALHGEPLLLDEPIVDEALGEPLDVESEEDESLSRPDISQWRNVRQKMSRTRRPPGASIAA